MRRGLKTGLIVGCGLLVLGIAVSAFRFLAAIRADPPTGALASLAGLPVADVNGKPIVLGAVAPRGRNTVVTFWASWCVPCLAETKALVKERSRFPLSELTIVAINLDALPRDKALLSKFLDRSGGRALIQVLGTNQTYSAITGHKTLALPRGFVFDRGGAPVISLAGFKPGDTEQKIDDVLRLAVRR